MSKKKPGQIWLFVLMFSVSVCGLSEAARHPDSAVKAFNEGVKAFNANQYNEAVASFDDAISKDSDFAEAYYARGACKYRLQEPDGAIMDLGDAIRLQPDLYDARAMRGVVNYEANRWDQALEDFSYVLERQPNDAQSLLGRGVIYLQREQSAEAAQDFKAFLRSHKDHPLAPKVKQLLASLEGKPATGTAASAGKPRPRSTAARAPSAPPSESTKELGASLLLGSHQMSEQFGRKVLRGERGEAVGDINSARGGAGSESQ